VKRIDGAGPPVEVAPSDEQVGRVAIGPNGDVYYSTATRVFRLAGGAGTPVRGAGTGVQGFGGDGGPATSAQVWAPHGLAFAADAALLVSDTGNDRIRRIDPATGVISSLAEVGIPDGLEVASDGTIYVAAARESRIRHLNASGAMPPSASFTATNGPSVVSVWPSSTRTVVAISGCCIQKPGVTPSVSFTAW